jgi:hypothetical protein
VTEITLQFLEGKNEIWRILTTGLPDSPRVAIIDADAHTALIDRPYRVTGTWRLRSSKNQTRLRLTVTSGGGRTLLAGRIVSDLRDVKLYADNDRT